MSKIKMVGWTCMALNPLNSSNLEQLTLKELSIICLSVCQTLRLTLLWFITKNDSCTK